MRSPVRLLLLLLMLLVLVGGSVSAQPADPPTPPGQRAQGPGGTDYAYQGVKVTRYGRGAAGYWVFEPRDADKTKALPVIAYVHGLNASDYGTTWLWIRHLVRKGNLVVFPQYQEGFLVDPRTFTDRSARAIAQALQHLDGKQHVLADTKRFALVGHSLGGTISANLAARHEHFNLPTARALMAVQPGDVRCDSGLGAFFPSLMEDHHTIPKGTLMLVVATEDDNIVGQTTARRIFRDTTQVPDRDKDYILLHADRHGRPSLLAHHLMAWCYIDQQGNVVADAYDFALWRWFDALTDAAFNEGEHRAIALGNTPEQRDLGSWSDGTAVRAPTVTDEP